MTSSDPVILAVEYEGVVCKSDAGVYGKDTKTSCTSCRSMARPNRRRPSFRPWPPGRNCKSETMNSGGHAMPCASGVTASATASTTASYGRTGSIPPSSSGPRRKKRSPGFATSSHGSAYPMILTTSDESRSSLSNMATLRPWKAGGVSPGTRATSMTMPSAISSSQKSIARKHAK